MDKAASSHLMRHINRSGVLDLIREQSPISRSQIARELRMSLPTVMRIVDDLTAENLVRDLGSTESSGGRPRQLLEFNGASHAVLGIDLGGNRMLGTLADLSGTIQHELAVPYRDRSSATTLQQLIQLIDDLLQAPRPTGQPVRGIGIGSPGMIRNEEGIVQYSPGLGWSELPLRQILEERFHLPVLIENDVNLAAMGESSFGAGRGKRSLIYISLGTRIGAGIILDGALHRGHHKAAGEVGYMFTGVQELRTHFTEAGPMDMRCSGASIAERGAAAARAAGVTPENLPASGRDVFDAARRNIPWALQVIDETIDVLSLMIFNISALLDPETIVLGGGIAQSADLFLDKITQRFPDQAPYTPEIVISQLGKRSAVMGAIKLVLNATTDYVTVERY